MIDPQLDTSLAMERAVARKNLLRLFLTIIGVVILAEISIMYVLWQLRLPLEHPLFFVINCIVLALVLFLALRALVVRPLVQEIDRRHEAELTLRNSQARLLAIFKEAAIGIALVDMDGQLVECNPALQRLLGYEKEELQDRPFTEITHPDDAARDWSLFQELIAGTRDHYQIDKRYLHKTGAIKHGYMTASLVRDANGKPCYLIKMVEDHTEKKAFLDRLRLSEKVIANTTEGITITDPQGTIVSVNRAFSQITGYAAEEALGCNPRILKSDRHDDAFYRDMWSSLLTTGQWEGEIWNRRKTGEAYPEWLTISSIQDEFGQTSHYVAVFYDITERKQHEEAMQYQAYHDALTGLPNRELFRDRLEQALEHADRARHLLAVMFLDLDRFKTINDTLGHFIGDRLLQQAAGRLQNVLRKNDTVARLGGDEFVILLPEITHITDASHIAEKILGTFRDPFLIDRHELFISASIGLSIFPGDGDDLDTLVKNADTALYRAKEGGRNTYRLYTSAMNAQALEQLELETMLRKAVERQEFVLHYQPRIELSTGRVTSMEALVRWQHPELGLVPPGKFIPLAEETGLIAPIGEWVLAAACAQSVAWQQAGFPALPMAVNLSARQFAQEDLVTAVNRALTETGLDPHYLELEITETVAMSNVKRSLPLMRQLQQQGIVWSIDDFGTGYSSLAYLKQFPAHALKIDQAFTRDIGAVPDVEAIIVAMISLAHNLNLRVIAEGVETAEQLAFLRDHGCEEMQGFHVSRPLPAQEFADAFLASHLLSQVGVS